MTSFQSIEGNYQDSDRCGQQHSVCDLNHNPDMETLAERLKREREQAGLTQTQLGQRAGCGQSLIGNLETGGQKSSAKIPQIAAALGINALYLSSARGPRTSNDNPTEKPVAEQDLASYETRARGIAAKIEKLPDDSPVLDAIELMLKGMPAKAKSHKQPHLSRSIDIKESLAKLSSGTGKQKKNFQSEK